MRENHLRTLHIASGDLWAGAEAQLFALVVEQQASGMDVAVVVMNPGQLADRLSESGVPLLVLDESEVGVFSSLLSIIRFARGRAVNIIHSHRQKENVLAALTALLCRARSIRTVHGLSELAGTSRRRRMVDRLDRAVGRWLQQRIVCVSQSTRDALTSQFPDRLLASIENGLDLTDYKYISRPADARGSAAQQPGRLEIAFFGRLVPVKRLDIILDIANACANSPTLGGVEFFIYGDGPQGHWLAEAIASRDAENLRTEGHTDDVAARMRVHDALLLVSDHEGLPMVVLEAMAVGLPVISHAVGGIPRVLDDGKCGILVKSQDTREYLRVFSDLLAKPDLGHRLADAARHRVETEYSITRTAQQYQALYRSIIGPAAK